MITKIFILAKDNSLIGAKIIRDHAQLKITARSAAGA
jgi:hypothetical protein